MSGAAGLAPTEAATDRPPSTGHRFTSESARQAGLKSAASRTTRGAPPSDEAIEDALRRRAVSSAKDAEVLLRWQQRPRPQPLPGEGIDGMGEEELARLHTGLMALAALEPQALAALVEAQALVAL